MWGEIGANDYLDTIFTLKPLEEIQSFTPLVISKIHYPLQDSVMHINLSLEVEALTTSTSFLCVGHQGCSHVQTQPHTLIGMEYISLKLHMKLSQISFFINLAIHTLLSGP